MSYESIVGAEDITGPLREHLSCLATSSGDDAVIEALVQAAEGARVDGEDLVVSFSSCELRCSPPARDGRYDGWPESFRKLMAVHESWELGGASGLCLGADYLVIDAPELGDEPQTALSAWGDQGYVFHPTQKRAGEAALVCWDHEDESVSAPLDRSIGEVFLRLLAKALDLDAPSSSSNEAPEGLDEHWQAAVVEEGGNPEEITSISLVDASINSLGPLSMFPKLEELTVVRCPVATLDGIEGLKKLETLRVGCPIRSISQLEGLTSLQELDLSDSNVEEIADLSGTELSSIDLSSTGITSLRGLESVAGLTNVSFSDTAVDDLTPLAGLSQLSFVNFNNTSVKDASALFDKNLLAVSCRGTAVPLTHLLHLFRQIAGDEDPEELAMMGGVSLYCDLDKAISEADLEALSDEDRETLAAWQKL